VFSNTGGKGATGIAVWSEVKVEDARITDLLKVRDDEDSHFMANRLRDPGYEKKTSEETEDEYDMDEYDMEVNPDIEGGGKGAEPGNTKTRTSEQIKGE